jgi:hypothetical protein
MAESAGMSVTSANLVSGLAANLDPSNAAAVSVQKIAQDQEKQQGEGAVALIQSAAPPPVGAHGEGTHINTYA